MFVPSPKLNESESRYPNSNDVIISDSLILQASRALSKQATSPGVLFDLAALIEAVVLYDHLLYLGDASHNIFDNLPLGHLLVKEGIIQSFTPPVSIQEVQDSIYNLFGIPDAYDKMDLSPIIARQDQSNVLPYYGDYDFFSPNQVSTVLAELELAERLPPFNTPDDPLDSLTSNLTHYCFSLVEMWTGDNSWARRPAQAFLVRTLVYWAISDRINITFYPDFTRLAIVAQITHHLHHSLSRGVIDVVARAFYLSPEELAWMNTPFVVTIPPFTSLVLERLGNGQQIGTVLLELRQEFTSLRATMRAYQQTIRTATMLGELQQARQVLASESARLAQKYPTQECIRIQETTSYYQRAALIGDRPRDPGAYAYALKFKPIEWIREWWIRRNAIHLTDLGTKLDQYEKYRKLMQKNLDIELDGAELKQYLQVENLMQTLYYKVNNPDY